MCVVRQHGVFQGGVLLYYQSLFLGQEIIQRSEKIVL